MKWLAIASILLGGCISSFGGYNIKCITEVPPDHDVFKVEMFDDGAYHALLRLIFINKNTSERVQRDTMRHELCHVTEWQNCLPLASLSGGWHSSEKRAIWDRMLKFNENCTNQ